MDVRTGGLRRWGRAAAWGLVMLTLAWGGIAQAAETTTYVLTDDQGTVLMLTDNHGNPIARFDHRPYGQQSGPVNAGPGYTGHVEDPDTGLVYMQARYYDSEVGRFLGVDPVTAYDNPTGAFNRYWYANNNPILNTDPTGMCVGSQRWDAPCNPDSKFPPEPRREVSPAVQRMRDTSDCGGCIQTAASSIAGVGGDAPGGGNAPSTVLNVTDVALSAYMLRAPTQLGSWETGSLAVSRYVGATRQQLARVAKMAKFANGVSFLAIGSSSYSLVRAAQTSDRLGAIGAGSDLAWSLFGLTGPVGAVGAAFYGATSLAVAIPAVNKLTVQPVANAMCSVDSSCL